MGAGEMADGEGEENRMTATARHTPPADATPKPVRCLQWRKHEMPKGGGYVRTALGFDGSLLVESNLPDRAGTGAGGEVICGLRIVVIPPLLAGAVARGLMADVRRRASSRPTSVSPGQ